jgi:hypothetical protein
LSDLFKEYFTKIEDFCDEDGRSLMADRRLR